MIIYWKVVKYIVKVYLLFIFSLYDIINWMVIECLLKNYCRLLKFIRKVIKCLLKGCLKKCFLNIKWLDYECLLIIDGMFINMGSYFYF